MTTGSFIVMHAAHDIGRNFVACDIARRWNLDHLVTAIRLLVDRQLHQPQWQPAHRAA
jgi:hypothetical protein